MSIFFKKINDNLGHKQGDALLCHISSQMKNVLGEGEFLSRIAGDEFVAIIDLSSSDLLQVRQQALVAAKRFLNEASKEIILSKTKVNAALSLGIYIIPEHGDSGDVLLHCADKAMYEVKKKKEQSIYIWGVNDGTSNHH